MDMIEKEGRSRAPRFYCYWIESGEALCKMEEPSRGCNNGHCINFVLGTGSGACITLDVMFCDQVCINIQSPLVS